MILVWFLAGYGACSLSGDIYEYLRKKGNDNDQ